MTVPAPTPGTERAWVGVGANLGDAQATVEQALRELAVLSRAESARASSLYRTEPLGDAGQPWYTNAAAALETQLEPEALLAELLALERVAGRPEPRARWSPRVLDLDLLLLGDLRVDSPALRLPHPGLASRRFVLVPLAEIAPGVRDPSSGRLVRELLAELDDPLRVEKISSEGHRIAATPGSCP